MRSGLQGWIPLSRNGMGWVIWTIGPKAVEKDGQPSLTVKYTSVEQAADVGPSSFQKDGLGRLDYRPREAGGEGQPSLALVWAPLAYKSPWDEPGVNARASSCLVPAKEFFAKDSLVGGMGPSAARRISERCSITDECFLEEASKYSLLKPSIVCVWGGSCLFFFFSFL